MSKITQLYEKLELYTEGDPPRHTLFVMGQLLGTPDQLLLIDPPQDVSSRFSLAENTAVLFTGAPQELGIPRLETIAGGVAHVRVGEHLLDVYSQEEGNVVFLPAVGVLCGGSYGSDLSLPKLAWGSDGGEELESLRLLAQLVKGHSLRLFIPREGSLIRDATEVMGRLAEDVSYLHGLRRVIPAAVRRGDRWDTVLRLGDSLLPKNRHTSYCGAIHNENVECLFRIS